MDGVLRDLVDTQGGLVTHALARQVVPEWTLRRACRSGRLVRVLPTVYVPGELVPGHDDGQPLISRLAPALGRRAALAWANGRAALSHLTALDVWGLHRQAAGDPLHLTVPTASGLRGRPGVFVHQRQGFRLNAPDVLIRHGVPITRLEAALVDSWPLLPPAERHGPVIQAANDRLTTPERLCAALAPLPKLAGRAALRTLLDRLADGCHSPLEIWGHERVFTGPRMPQFRRQFRMRIGPRTMYLDLYAERERVDIELDGATTHGHPRQREIDLRRDALLAGAGILTVRFSHRRLVHEPDEVRRETLAILASRR